MTKLEYIAFIIGIVVSKVLDMDIKGAREYKYRMNIALTTLLILLSNVMCTYSIKDFESILFGISQNRIMTIIGCVAIQTISIAFISLFCISKINKIHKSTKRVMSSIAYYIFTTIAFTNIIVNKVYNKITLTEQLTGDYRLYTWVSLFIIMIWQAYYWIHFLLSTKKENKK